jgi:Cysteine-rich CPXCG
MRKRSLRSEVEVMCPYCGDVGLVPIDEGGGTDQEYIEDCPTCCKPRSVRFHADEDDISVELSRA